MRMSTITMILVAAAMTLPFLRLMTLSAQDIFRPLPQVITR